MLTPDSKTALIVVDVQIDFCPGGALAVPGGDAVIPPLARAIERFRRDDLPVVYTRDWHPGDHSSFSDQGGPWPPHCVADSPGAAFHAELPVAKDAWIVSKATRPEVEAYSGFGGTTLGDDLRSRGIERVVVGGLATDYCVKATVLDAIELGFEAWFLTDATRAVDVAPGDGEAAVDAMRAAGAEMVTVDELAGIDSTD